MSWKNTIKKDERSAKEEKTMKDFVDDVVRSGDRILRQYTKDNNIEDDDDLAIELRDVLRKIFISLASDSIEKNSDL